MSVEDILQKARGQQIRVPCLFSLSPTWRARLNPEYDETVEDAIEAWRQSCLLDLKSYKQNVGADCAFFTRTMNPEVTKSMMKIAGTLCSWVFAWDDVLDLSTIDNGPKQRDLFGSETQKIIQQSILTAEKESQVVCPNSILVQTFYKIGTSIRVGSKHVSVQEFLCKTLCDFVAAAIKMEAIFRQGVVQGLEEYLNNRVESSCVYGMIAISLYARDFDIPAWFLDHPLPKEMMRLVSRMVSLDNDMVSAHHEMRYKHVDNMVLLLVHHRSMTPQEAVDHCCQLIRDDYLAFESVESNILSLATIHEMVDTARLFITCCKDVRIGLVNWTYHIKRYFECEPSQGGEVSITM